MENILKFLGARIAAINLFRVYHDKPWNYLWYCYWKHLRPPPLSRFWKVWGSMSPFSGVAELKWWSLLFVHRRVKRQHLGVPSWYLVKSHCPRCFTWQLGVIDQSFFSDLFVRVVVLCEWGLLLLISCWHRSNGCSSITCLQYRSSSPVLFTEDTRRLAFWALDALRCSPDDNAKCFEMMSLA